jgi:hypothetical protein
MTVRKAAIVWSKRTVRWLKGPILLGGIETDKNRRSRAKLIRQLRQPGLH